MLAAFGLGALPVFLGMLNHDAAWFLHAASRILAGQKLYVDLVEINTPLIVWLSCAPILLARAVGTSEVLAFRLLVLGLIACSLGVSRWTLRRVLPDQPAGRRLLLFLALFILLALPGYHFGQREHLMLALVLPYLLLASGQAMGRPLGRDLPWILGIMAGVGIALKPHFLLPWLAVEADLARARRGWRAWLRPEALAVAAVGLTYAIAVLVLTPEYLSVVAWAGRAYAATTVASFSSLMSEPPAVISMVAWLGFALVRPGGNCRACCRLILVSNVCFLVIVLIQFKGYAYHYYPLIASAILLLGLLFVGSRGLDTNRRRNAGVLCGGLAAVLMLQASVDRVNESRLWRGCPDESDTPLGHTVRLAKDYARGGSIFVFSAVVVDSFPLVTYSGVGWASRHPCLGLLAGLYSASSDRRTVLAYHRGAAMSETERFLFDTVVSDLLRERPDLLFVDESPYKPAFHGQRFDYLEYFARDPRFAAFLRQYEPLTEVDRFGVYRRKTARSVGADLPELRAGLDSRVPSGRRAAQPRKPARLG